MKVGILKITPKCRLLVFLNMFFVHINSFSEDILYSPMGIIWGQLGEEQILICGKQTLWNVSCRIVKQQVTQNTVFISFPSSPPDPMQFQKQNIIITQSSEECVRLLDQESHFPSFGRRNIDICGYLGQLLLLVRTGGFQLL